MKISSLCRTLVLGSTLGLASTVGFLSLTAGPALAGPGGAGHSHEPASKDQVLVSSKKARDRLIKDGKIDAVWQDIAPDNAEQKTFKSGKKEWVVTFKDPKAADKAKETLYIFFSNTGNFLASNFTGK